MWFLMRINLNKYPSLRLFFISIMIICGLISIFVFNIMLVNKKDVFAEFELFSNIKLSNAYAAYLAFILPLSLNGLLIFRKGNILNHKLDSRFLACCFYSISLIIITCQVIIHPAKNIWISIILSCSWIFWMRLIGWNKTNHFINKYKKIISITSVSAFLILSFFSTQGYLKKLEIGDNRLLKQNITTKAILEHPVKGIGYGMFNNVFSQIR